MITGTTRATPVLVWSRAALLGTVVVAVSSVSHVSADGLLPGPVAMLALTLAATVVSARFLTRQASPVRLVAMLMAGQVAIHGALTALAGHGSAPIASHAAGDPAAAGRFAFDGLQAERTGSYFDQVEAMQAAAGGAAGAGSGSVPFAHTVEHLLAQSPLMVLAHLAGVAVLGLWLAVGERALWTVLTLSTTRLTEVVAHLGSRVLGGTPGVLLDRVRRAPVLATTSRSAVPLPHLLHHVVAHRGPPALLAA